MTSKESAYLIANLFVKHRGAIAVISPGSRNAPLIKAFQNLEAITCDSVVDERCAGFYALGVAIATKRPVALICTSGTALLNYSPAIAESFYLGVALVVISADRPLDRIDSGEGQSIRQSNVYSNFQKGFLNISEDVLNNLNLIVEANNLFKIQNENKKGPIHFNLPFSEPLYEEKLDHSILSQEIHKLSSQKLTLLKDSVLLKDIIELWSKRRNKLVLCGKLDVSNEFLENLALLNQRTDTVILYESTSNLNPTCGIGTIDRTLAASSLEELKPELVVTIGEHTISKKIKQLLKETKGLKHIHISDDGKQYDTFQSDHNSIKISAVDFVQHLLNSTEDTASEFSLKWKQGEEIGGKLHNQFLLDIPFCDLSVFQNILGAIPNSFHLQSGNSSVIRYIQLFDFNQWRYCHANRGTSGIDGSTSTAVGYSSAIEEPTLLITGDISFLYDSNGLWNNSIRSDFRIIVINNGGGGIFKFIPGPDTVLNSEKFFEAKHSIDIEPIAKTFGFAFLRANNQEELENCIANFFDESNSPKILEIRTPREVNADVLKQYFSFIETNKNHIE